MTAPRVEFFFDFISPYAYLAWRAVNELCARHGAELVLRPVLLAGILDHWGQLGPAEIPAKREFLFKDCLRIAALAGVPFVGPRAHPFNPLAALRVALPEVAGARQRDVVEAVWAMSWARGGDAGAPDELRGALDAAGLDGAALLAAAQSQPAKDALRRETESAVARGVFGVPTMIAGGELFWGSDRVAHLELFLAGRDPLDRERASAFLARPRAADRKRKAP